MRDVAIQTAGAAAIVVAIIHGVLGETKVFANARIEPAWVKLLIRLVWQGGAAAWVAFGVLLIAVPYMGSEPARLWIAGAAAAVYAVHAIGNAWATCGRHFGWMALTVVSALALAGA
jgi:hypothetical protein